MRMLNTDKQFTYYVDIATEKQKVEQLIHSTLAGPFGRNIAGAVSSNPILRFYLIYFKGLQAGWKGSMSGASEALK